MSRIIVMGTLFKSVFMVLLIVPIIKGASRETSNIPGLKTAEACYGADQRCSNYELHCDPDEVIELGTLSYGSKVGSNDSFCNLYGVSNCLLQNDTDLCCHFNAADSLHNFSAANRSAVMKNCEGRESCSGSAPRYGLPPYSSYVYMLYTCVKHINSKSTSFKTSLSSPTARASTSSFGTSTNFQNTTIKPHTTEPTVKSSTTPNNLITSTKESIASPSPTASSLPPSSLSTTKAVQSSLEPVSSSSRSDTSSPSPLSSSTSTTRVTSHQTSSQSLSASTTITASLKSTTPQSLNTGTSDIHTFKPNPIFSGLLSIETTTHSKMSNSTMSKSTSQDIHTTEAKTPEPSSPTFSSSSTSSTSTSITSTLEVKSSTKTPSSSTNKVSTPMSLKVSKDPLNSLSRLPQHPITNISRHPHTVSPTAVTSGSSAAGAGASSTQGTTQSIVTTTKGSDSNNGLVIGLTVGIILAAIIIVGIVVMCVFARLKRKENDRRNYVQNTNIFYSFPEDHVDSESIAYDNAEIRKRDATLSTIPRSSHFESVGNPSPSSTISKLNKPVYLDDYMIKSTSLSRQENGIKSTVNPGIERDGYPSDTSNVTIDFINGETVEQCDINANRQNDSSSKTVTFDPYALYAKVQKEGKTKF